MRPVMLPLDVIGCERQKKKTKMVVAVRRRAGNGVSVRKPGAAFPEDRDGELNVPTFLSTLWSKTN